MNRFRAIFNEMKKRFNDEDRDDILIPQNPFRKYAWPQVLETKKRALTIEQIKKIRDMELDKHRTVARDAFMLSLYLAGMNTVDLYTATNCKDGRITYNRTKTATRRKDAALISIRVFPETQKLLDIYRDHSRVFDFYKRYKSAMQFNHIVNLYLKEIGRSVGIEDLEFGAARASFATLARNTCGVSKWDIHESLNHVDPSISITDIYIKKDWSVVDNTIQKVLNALKEETPTPVLQVVRDSKESLSA
jgi:integrase